MAIKKRIVRNVTEEAAVLVAQGLVQKIGEVKRQIEELESHLNTRIAEIKKEAEKESQPLNVQLDGFIEELFLYSQLNRDLLTQKGKSKSIKTLWGVIQWRFNRPSVKVLSEKEAIAELKAKGLGHLVKTIMVEEIDKNAILQDPDAVSELNSLKIEKKEEFVVKPEKTSIIVRLVEKLKKAVDL